MGPILPVRVRIALTLVPMLFRQGVVIALPSAREVRARDVRRFRRNRAAQSRFGTLSYAVADLYWCSASAMVPIALPATYKWHRLVSEIM